jgi:hypothetical protein
MNINNLLNQYVTEWWTTPKDFYRCTIEVNGLFYVSIIAGEGTYSTPAKKLDDFSQYEEYEIAFFDMEKKWLVVESLDDDDEWNAVTYGREPNTSVYGHMSPSKIQQAINALLEAWQG